MKTNIFDVKGEYVSGKVWDDTVFIKPMCDMKDRYGAEKSNAVLEKTDMYLP